MKRIVFILAALMYLALGCGGIQIDNGQDPDPCAWLPEGNQAAVIDYGWELKLDGWLRHDLFTVLFADLVSLPNVFDPTPNEISDCLNVLLEEVY